METDAGPFVAESISNGLRLDVKRIGEILVANGWIETSILQRALVKQRETGARLCSLLVASGVIDADDASRALGEQHGVAAVLQRHIDRRDRSLTDLLSAALARACVALPIGRMGNGDVIVCVRDPSPALATQLARAMKEPICLAVAPAHQLEQLVLETYGADDANEFDVDLSTGPVMSLDLEEEQIEAMSDDVMADLGSLELVSLDDTGVTKDASQNQIPIGNHRQPTLPPLNVSVDGPTHRSAATSPLVDAPTYRSQAAIVVDAPSQRSALPPVARTTTIPPGRAALEAAGPAIARTQTPVRSSLDATAGSAMPGGPDPAGGPAAPEAPAIGRTQTSARTALSSAAASAAASIAAASSAAATTEDARSASTSLPHAAPPPEASDEVSVIASPVIEDWPAPAAREPAASAPAAPSSIAPLPASAPRDSTPAITPAAARPLGTPVIPIPSVVAPPAGASRAPPAALAALQRAAVAASRTMTPPPRDRPTAALSPPTTAAAPSATPSPPAAAAAAAPTAATTPPGLPTERVLPEPPSTIALGTESQGAPVPDPIAVGTQLPTARLAVSERLSQALTSLLAAATLDAAIDVLMGFAAKRWSSALLLEIDQQAATGVRGHGAQLSDELAQWTVMSLQEPSLLQAAFASRDVASATPSGHGDVEERLQRLLGMARAPSAIAIVVDGKPGFLLAVGDPDGDDLKTAAADLERLAHGAGAAFTRLRSR